MLLLWLVFMVMLFVVEPLASHRLPKLAFLDRAHKLLLGMSAIVLGAAVLGAHGLL